MPIKLHYCEGHGERRFRWLFYQFRYSEPFKMARVGHPASKTSMWMPYFLGAPLFLRGTDLVMVLPKRAGILLQDYYNLKLLSTPILLENFTYRLIWHERVHSDPAMRWFRNLIAEEIHAHS
jgi:DNA-binding transcriptional LysR family regulator